MNPQCQDLTEEKGRAGKEPGFSARHAENDREKKIGQPIRLNHYRVTACADRAGKSVISFTTNF